MSADEEHGSRIPDRWAQLRHAIIGTLLASPPEPGELHERLVELSATRWKHPQSGDLVHFGLSTIERWYYAARKERRDPMRPIARKVRRDRGRCSATSNGPTPDPLVIRIGRRRREPQQLHLRRVIAE